MPMLTYSVVMPCYNCESTIERALDSLYEQEIQPEKIICVNNNSTDSTPRILKDIARKNKALVIANEEKQGASAARNKGASLVTSTYIQFLDSDDILLSDKVFSQLNLASQHNNNPLIIEGYVSKNNLNDRGNKVFCEPDIWTGLISGKLGYTVSNLWPAHLFHKTGGFNETLKTSEEYDLLFRLLSNGAPVIYSPEFNTIKINDNNNSLTRTNQQDNWERYIKLREKMLDWLESKSASEQQHYLRLFDSIRMAYKYTPDAARQFYVKRIKQHLVIAPTEVTSAKYIFLYQIFGFPLADKLLAYIK